MITPPPPVYHKYPEQSAPKAIMTPDEKYPVFPVATSMSPAPFHSEWSDKPYLHPPPLLHPPLPLYPPPPAIAADPPHSDETSTPSCIEGCLMSTSFCIEECLTNTFYCIEGCIVTAFIILYAVLPYALLGTCWSWIGGAIGWSVRKSSSPYSSASPTGVLRASALGGAILGVAFGFLYWIFSGSCSGTPQREYRWFFTLIGIFGQCVGSAILRGKQEGLLDTIHALRASTIGLSAISVILFVIVAFARYHPRK